MTERESRRDDGVLTIASIVIALSLAVVFGEGKTKDYQIPEPPDDFIVTPSPNTVFVMTASSITVPCKTGAARAAQIVNAGLVTNPYFDPDPIGIDDDFDWYAYQERR